MAPAIPFGKGGIGKGLKSKTCSPLQTKSALAEPILADDS